MLPDVHGNVPHPILVEPLPLDAPSPMPVHGTVDTMLLCPEVLSDEDDAEGVGAARLKLP